ncbi:hypothetical protein [Chondromyces crocatus]|uniref:Lipoprotein n=1 Tax=Chondromyces crocatus TaxID=52 RepID=A0A0K1EGM5_CHOCO|nr:hypothetical protein [Chondromyces crocatus]AKT40021.1 uncharacterized protein CMC5_041740 [Chondromyces crocatus]
MATKMGKTLAFTAISGLVAGLAACGGSAPPAETPEAPAAADAPAAEGGEKAGCSGAKEGEEKAGCSGAKDGEKGGCSAKNGCSGAK